MGGMWRGSACAWSLEKKEEGWDLRLRKWTDLGEHSKWLGRCPRTTIEIQKGFRQEGQEIIFAF